MQARHTASVIPDGVIKVYFFHVQIGDLDECAILPRMSSYRVLQYDYMRTLVLLRAQSMILCAQSCAIPT